MQPSFRQVYDCLFNRSPNEAKAHEDSLTRGGPVDLGTIQNTAETAWPEFFLFSHKSDSLGGFSAIL